jgi:hypothetical protein
MSVFPTSKHLYSWAGLNEVKFTHKQHKIKSPLILKTAKNRTKTLIYRVLSQIIWYLTSENMLKHKLESAI